MLRSLRSPVCLLRWTAAPGSLALGLALAVGCTAPATVQAQTRGEGAQQAQGLEAQVRALLSGIEDAPRPEELTTLGEPGLEVLVRLASDARELGVVRLRAITAVGWFRTPRAQAYLESILAERGRDPLQLRAALRAYGAQRGADVSEASLAPVTRHAQHPDVVVREAVLLTVVAARAQAPQGARASLERLLERLLLAEPDADLVRAIRARR